MTIVPGCGWLIYSNPVEIMPADDVFTHVEGLSCWCAPRENDFGGIVHNAADRREDFTERGRKTS